MNQRPAAETQRGDSSRIPGSRGEYTEQEMLRFLFVGWAVCSILDGGEGESQHAGQKIGNTGALENTDTLDTIDTLDAEKDSVNR